MGQEDRFKKEIERLARALAKALADLTGAKTTATLEQNMQKTSEIFKTELGMDTTDIAHLPPGDWEQLIKSKNLSYDELSLLAEVIYTLAEKEHAQRPALYQKALWLMLYLNSTGHTWSMDRDQKISKLKSLGID